MQVQKFITCLTDQSPQNIRSQLYKRGVLASYDQNDGRIVFYASKNQRFSSDTDMLKLECNGLVFDTQNMKPLVIPQLLPKSSINTNIINMHLSNDMYDILYINDGTVINLYWWDLDKSWHISTARSYDLTNKKWGLLTYKEVLKLILNDNEEKFYNMLDKEQSYTFGIKYEGAHPFNEGKDEYINKIWFIQSVHLENKEVYTDFDNSFNIPTQEFVVGKINNVTDLFASLNNALTGFINHADKPLYGYILRSKNIQHTGAYSNILLESTLLQKIRLLYYHSSLNMSARYMQYDRNIFILIYSYLDTNRNFLFTKLFPQYIPLFDKLGMITTNLVRHLIAYTKNKRNDGLLKSSAKFQVYVKTIHESLNNQYKINITDRNIIKFITTYLLTEKWVDVYYNLFTSEN